MATPTGYVYKHYSAGEYIGNLKPINDFSLSTEINQAGSQIQLDLPVAFQEASPTLTYDEVVDENGDELVDHNGDNVVSDLAYSVSGIPSLNDKIEVWEFSSHYVNGKLKFSGLVSKYASSYKENTTTIYVVSYGVQFDNYLVQVLPGSVLTSNAAAIDSSETLYTSYRTALNRNTSLGQTFQVGIAADILSIRIPIANTSVNNLQVGLSITEGTPIAPGAIIGSITRDVPPQSLTQTDFQFLTTVSLASSTTYFITVSNVSYGKSTVNSLVIGTEATGTYASGSMYLYNDSTGWGTATASDIIFTVYTATGALGNQFNSQDPSDILTQLIDTFNSLGGVPTYSSTSIADTNTVVSYTFKFSTFLEAIKKIVELAPANWYWFADPGSNVIYFDTKSGTANHTFVLGKHVGDLELDYSLENVKNVVYFSGGDTGSGENLTANSANESSVSKYGMWLATPSDNRVTTTSTANIIMQSILDEYSRPKFSAKLTVLSNKYNTTDIRVGQMVGFANFNSLIDSLLLQIVAINYTPDETTLTLEVLPPTQSKRIEDIKRNLNKQQTENNPSDT